METVPENEIQAESVQKTGQHSRTCRTHNKRFGASGGVTSNNRSWETDRLWF